MSVVQISRIQQRRGKKNGDFGFPQLASGELGWAIDTQELYIGNGAVSEGAPYVGNSKVITEHDDILQFVALYEYQKNNHYIVSGPIEGQPINRSLQDRLDDIVSVKSFGAVGDGVADDTNAIQRAINQLFLNNNTKANISSRVVLYMEPGEYKISNELRIPPFAHIIGAGIDSTIIKQIADYPVFKMVANDPMTELGYLEFENMGLNPQRPKYILIAALTLKTTAPQRLVYLDNTDSTLFDRVRFFGNYNDLLSTPDPNHIAVEARGTSKLLRSFNVLFNYCIFDYIGKGFYSDSDHDNISFDHCTFERLYEGINIGGGELGALNTNITNCYFNLIVTYGIYIKKGYGNISSNNKFMLVGNSTGDYSNPTVANIKFDTDGNQSINDYFQRNTILKDKDSGNAFTAFVPAVDTANLVYDNNNLHKNLEETAITNPIVFIRLPLANTGTYIIDYVIKKFEKRNTNNTVISGTSAIRTGTITVCVDVINVTSTMTDNYHYVGDESVENIAFSARLHNYKSGDTIPQTLPVDTLTIDIVNPIRNGFGTMNFVYRMMTQ